MGVVPWVLRKAPVDTVALAGESVAAVSEAAIVTGAEIETAVISPVVSASTNRSAIVESTTALPDEIAELSVVLPNRAIAAFEVRGSRQSCLGSREASVLVVVQPPAASPKVAELPLNNQETQLFELMLRAIGLTRKDTLQCILQTNDEGAVASGIEAGGARSSETVETLSGNSVRTVLLLQKNIGNSEVASDHQFAFGSASLPAWRLPHPALLLSDPIQKRQAWQILKAVRRVLAAD